MAGRPRRLKPEPSHIRGLCLICGKCKQAKYRQSGKTRYRANCVACNNRKYGVVMGINSQAQKKASYNQRLRKYGITEEQHKQLLEDQSLCCAICLKPETEEGRKFAIDHCHETGRVRGLLCFRCNTGIGKLEDSPDRLRRAIAYLEG